MAAERCLSDWGGDRNDIDLVLFAGMSRTGHVSEPAIATFIAGELQINDWIESGSDRKTLAFDIYNGAVGFLNACEVASRMIQSGDYQRALITASEFEVNIHFPEIKLGFVEAGSAVLMEMAAEGRTGFGSFAWHYATEHLEARTILGRYRHGRPLYDPQYRSDLEDLYLESIQPAVRELLAQEGLTIDQIALVLPPQFSSAFNARLAAAIGIPLPKVVDLGQQGLDLFTSAVPFALEHIQRERIAQPGEIGLVVQVGSGLQVGCATYYF
jgi:3-oxoacyl-[acyl-carrier-protein] synthase III